VTIFQRHVKLFVPAVVTVASGFFKAKLLLLPVPVAARSKA